MIASQSPTVTRQLPDSCLTAPTVRQYDSTTGPTGPDRTRQLTHVVTVRKTRQYTTGHPTGYDRPRQSRQYDSLTALRQLSDRTRQDPTDTTDPTATGLISVCMGEKEGVMHQLFVLIEKHKD